mgnify:CR=1 FL=1
MEVIILACGLGTRFHSVVKEVPKCMTPVVGKPFLWYLLKYLTRYDVNRVILSVGYLRNIIEGWIDEVRDEFPFEFDYVVEEQPFGTGGEIKLALKKTTTFDIVVLNGDTFFDVNLNKLMECHRLYPSSVTLALKPMYNFERYGRVIIDQIDNRIVEFKEKEFCQEGLINGGVYIINKLDPIFDVLPEKFSFEKEVLETQCGFGKLFGIIQNRYFIDIGVPEDYRRANEELTDKIG